MTRYISSFLTILLLLGVASEEAICQTMNWRKLGSPKFRPYRNADGPAELGAIKTKGSLVVAGWQNLIISTDLGSTWRDLPSPFIYDIVMDIDIYDEWTFCIQTALDGLYYTSDQGISWSWAHRGQGSRGVTFNKSPYELLLAGGISGHVTKVSIGKPSQPITISGFPYSSPRDVQIAADGCIQLLGGGKGGAGIYFSYDNGVSWAASTSITESDCNTFITDQNDPSRYMIINEDWTDRQNLVSELFTTTDNGASWVVTYSSNINSLFTLSGNSTTGCNDYFAGTRNEVLRSRDKGVSWESIGGPPTAIDSRALSALDDSLIFAIDTNGAIWSTIPASHTSGTLISTNDLFSHITLPQCDSTIMGTVYFGNSGCETSLIKSIEIIGLDSLDYKIIDSLSVPATLIDSAKICFTPSHLGKTNARLRITRINGDVHFVNLTSTVKQTPLKSSKNLLFKNTKIPFCSTMSDTLKLFSSCPFNISSISITGSSKSSFLLTSKAIANLPFDSIVTVTCIPQNEGPLYAFLHILSVEGDSLDIPILPVVESPPKFTITESDIADVFTDTIGGDVTIKIPIRSNKLPAEAEFTIHYDNKYLVFVGVFDTKGNDYTVSQDRNKSAKIAVNTGLDSILYAKFLFYPVDSVCTRVTIDSINPTAYATDCLVITSPLQISTEICSPQNCENPYIAKFVRYGDLPDFSIRPNPTSRDITISSTKKMDVVNVFIYDVGGNLIRLSHADFSQMNMEMVLHLQFLAQGVYFAHISTISSKYVIPFIVKH